MQTVILPTVNGPDVYINPEYVVSIEGENDVNRCFVRVHNTGYEVPLHKHLAATILETERRYPDKFVSYKDWEWKGE